MLLKLELVFDLSWSFFCRVTLEVLWPAWLKTAGCYKVWSPHCGYVLVKTCLPPSSESLCMLTGSTKWWGWAELLYIYHKFLLVSPFSELAWSSHSHVMWNHCEKGSWFYRKDTPKSWHQRQVFCSILWSLSKWLKDLQQLIGYFARHLAEEILMVVTIMASNIIKCNKNNGSIL